jgi:hypothetical protein
MVAQQRLASGSSTNAQRCSVEHGAVGGLERRALPGSRVRASWHCRSEARCACRVPPPTDLAIDEDEFEQLLARTGRPECRRRRSVGCSRSRRPSGCWANWTNNDRGRQAASDSLSGGRPKTNPEPPHARRRGVPEVCATRSRPQPRGNGAEGSGLAACFRPDAPDRNPTTGVLVPIKKAGPPTGRPQSTMTTL